MDRAPTTGGHGFFIPPLCHVNLFTFHKKAMFAKQIASADGNKNFFSKFCAPVSMFQVTTAAKIASNMEKKKMVFPTHFE